MPYQIITDSCANLTDEMIEQLDVDIISLTVRCGDEEYKSYVKGEVTDNAKFYKMMRDGKILETSHLNMVDGRDMFESYLKQGIDVLYMAFSSALSGTYNVATLIAKELSSEYPERKIIVVDTKCASMGQGLLVSYASWKKQEGLSIEEVRDWVESNKLHLCHWFTVDDLFHLKRGGRVSATTAIVGSVLGIKPVLHVDDEGRLINMGKIRGRGKSLDELVRHLKETIIEPEKQVIYISHGDCLEDALYVEKKVRELYNVKDVKINYVDPVIGAHSGPGTVALFFMGTKR